MTEKIYTEKIETRENNLSKTVVLERLLFLKKIDENKYKLLLEDNDNDSERWENEINELGDEGIVLTHDVATVIDTEENKNRIIENALILRPVKQEAAKYVEVDDWTEPIQVSEDGLKAVHFLEDIINTDSYSDVKMNTLNDLLKKESYATRVYICQRLIRSYGEKSKAMLQLLPWDQLSAELEAALEVKTNKADEKILREAITEKFGEKNQGYMLWCFGEVAEGLRPNIIAIIKGTKYIPETRAKFITILKGLKEKDYIPEITKELIKKLQEVLEEEQTHSVN